MVTVGAWLLLTGCGPALVTDGPPDIVYGRDICLQCGMVISEDRYAAGYRFDGEARRFDDIGNMLLYGAEHGELPMAQDDSWVHDYDTRRWIGAVAAWYVVAPGLVTPMGYGIAAFADREAASSLAAERGGRVVGWPELLEYSIEPDRLTDRHDTGNEGSTH